MVLMLVCGAMMFGGCQSHDHPWAGTPYSPPSSSQGVAGSIYAPMPEILPEVIQGDLDLDPEANELLKELNEFKPGR